MIGLLTMIAAIVLAPGAPLPVATPKAPLKEIGHVRAVSAFCSAFDKHFNGAARPILASDAVVGYIGFTLGSIEPHYHARGGELLLYDDRVHMMHYVGNVQKLIPQAQREIDALRATGKLANDPVTAKETVELAAQLQKALDKQRQIAIDTLGVVQALNDIALGSNDNEVHPRAVMSERNLDTIDPLEHLAAIRDANGPKASTELQSQPPGAYDPYTASTPANARDVRSYLRWQNQLDRIGDAEGAAATTAQTIVERCG